MKKTLWELYLNAYDHSSDIAWRIYGNKSHRLLCDDYQQTTSDDLDNLIVVRCTRKRTAKKDYWRIVVAD